MVKLIDLTHPWHADLPPFPGYASPVVRWIKRMPENRIYSKMIETNTHNGTHIDAPIHYNYFGKDMASIPLEQLYGPGVVVDLKNRVKEWSIYTSDDVEENIEVEEGDIVIIHTGWHAYYNPRSLGCKKDTPEPDETKYFFRHPGPNKKFADWARKKRLRWIGVDTGSADHPMNTSLRYIRPDLASEFETKSGKSLDSVFAPEDFFTMHQLLGEGIIHAENVGGEIDTILNQRVKIGAFAWKFIGGDASICRIVAFVD
jgi:kynurenine formamidase